jgi:hypothetical protein
MASMLRLRGKRTCPTRRLRHEQHEGLPRRGEGALPAGPPGPGLCAAQIRRPLPLPAGLAPASLHPADAPRMPALVAQGKPMLDVQGKPEMLDKYIPVARRQKWVNPEGTLIGDHCCELAEVEHGEQFHRDSHSATTLRGYVQIYLYATDGLSAPSVRVSKAVRLLFYPDAKPCLVNRWMGSAS